MLNNNLSTSTETLALPPQVDWGRKQRYNKFSFFSITNIVYHHLWLKEGGSVMMMVIQTVGFVARDNDALVMPI